MSLMLPSLIPLLRRVLMNLALKTNLREAVPPKERYLVKKRAPVIQTKLVDQSFLPTSD
jgi:hypothetical protein